MRCTANTLVWSSCPAVTPYLVGLLFRGDIFPLLPVIPVNEEALLTIFMCSQRKWRNQLFKRKSYSDICTAVCIFSNMQCHQHEHVLTDWCILQVYCPNGCTAEALWLQISILSIKLHTMLYSPEKLTVIDLFYLTFFFFPFFEFCFSIFHILMTTMLYPSSFSSKWKGNTKVQFHLGN